ncbi:MAG TPA: crosslink repair DNA glycosylase YcaQ family protein [Anaerolineaceae bacterium]|nr:crosslink repair DNA glycosylase YcaQ family protein [Anaerolineaceae bacterium]
MSRTSLDPEQLQAFRDRAFLIGQDRQLNSAEEAVEYVNQRGFVFFWPIKGVLFPSLWTAAAGDRPVPDEHDDPGHKTWGWKDSLLGQRRWYYGRVLHRRNAMVSLAAAPYFYALTENYGSPEEDYLLQYEQGRLTLEARLVYEALLTSGPLDTISLRRGAHLTSRDSDGRFNKALDVLQGDFKILPVGIAEAGAWKYAFIYEITARHFPDLPEQARYISEKEARIYLLRCYFQSMGVAQTGDLTRLFGWKPGDLEPPLRALFQAGELVPGVELTGKPGNWIALPDLLRST